MQAVPPNRGVPPPPDQAQPPLAPPPRRWPAMHQVFAAGRAAREEAAPAPAPAPAPAVDVEEEDDEGEEAAHFEHGGGGPRPPPFHEVIDHAMAHLDQGDPRHPDGRHLDPQAWLMQLNRGPYVALAAGPHLQGRQNQRRGRETLLGGGRRFPVVVQVGCGGAEERLEVAEDATVGEVKDEIALRTRIPLFAQKLVSGNSVLENDEVPLRAVVPEFCNGDSAEDPDSGTGAPSCPNVRLQVCRLCSEHDANWLVALQTGKQLLACRLPRFLWTAFVPRVLEHEPVAKSAAISRTVQSVREASKRQRDLEERIREALIGTGFPADLLGNECFMWMAVQMPFDVVNWLPFMFLAATATLQEDRHIAIAAVRNNPYTLAFLSNTLRADRDIVLEAVSHCGSVLYFAPTVYYSDKEILHAAVHDCGMALSLASEELRADKEVVLRAVKDCGLALQFADAMLQADEDVVAAAVQQSGVALQHASPKLRARKEIVLNAVRRDGHALEHADASLQKDIEVVLIAMEGCDAAFAHASPSMQESLRQDRSVVLKALEISAVAYEYTSPKLQEDREVFLAAVMKQCGIDIPFAEHNGSYEMVAESISVAGWADLSRARACLRQAWQSHRAFGLEAVRHCTAPPFSSAYKQLAEHVREDKEVALAAVQMNGQLFLQVPYKLRCDFDIVVAALQQKRDLVYYVEPTLRKRALEAVEPSSIEGKQRKGEMIV